MKRTLAVIMAVLLTLSLVGCNKANTLKENDNVSRRGPSVSSSEETVSEDESGAESESLFSSAAESSSSEEESDTSTDTSSDSDKDLVSSAVSKNESKSELNDDDSLIPKSVKDPKSVKMSENIYDFTIEIGGNVYQLPLTVHDFMADGWSYQADDSDDAYMDANSYLMLGADFENKDGKLVRVEVTNYASRKMKVDNCYITGFSYPSYGTPDDRAAVKFSKGIEVQKSKTDDVKAAYGEPTSYDTNSSGTIYNYKVEDSFYRSYTFNFDADNVMKYFSVTDKVEVPDNYVEPPVSTAAPDYVGEYKAPSDLGSDAVSGRIQIDKVVYQLPCPFKAFIDDGWKIDGDKGEYEFIASGGNESFTILKQGYEIEIKVKNYTDLALPIEYGQVTYVTAYSYRTKDLNVAVPGGINMQSAAADLESGDNAKVYSNKDNNDFYKAYKDSKEDDYSHYLSIYVDHDDNKINNITLTYDIDED